MYVAQQIAVGRVSADNVAEVSGVHDISNCPPRLSLRAGEDAYDVAVLIDHGRVIKGRIEQPPAGRGGHLIRVEREDSVPWNRDVTSADRVLNLIKVQWIHAGLPTARGGAVTMLLASRCTFASRSGTGRVRSSACRRSTTSECRI